MGFDALTVLAPLATERQKLQAGQVCQQCLGPRLAAATMVRPLASAASTAGLDMQTSPIQFGSRM